MLPEWLKTELYSFLKIYLIFCDLKLFFKFSAVELIVDLDLKLIRFGIYIQFCWVLYVRAEQKEVNNNMFLVVFSGATMR